MGAWDSQVTKQTERKLSKPNERREKPMLNRRAFLVAQRMAAGEIFYSRLSPRLSPIDRDQMRSNGLEIQSESPRHESTFFYPLHMDRFKERLAVLEQEMAIADNPPYPQWICGNCGEAYGRKLPMEATWHNGTCEVCGRQGFVTEPRDFGHLRNEWKNHKNNDCRHKARTDRVESR